VSYLSILTREDAVYLAGLYRDDIGVVESFLGRPLAVWREIDLGICQLGA
jgi:hypothetical protein